MSRVQAVLPSPMVMLVTDRVRLQDRERSGDEVLDDVVREAVLGGVNVVQLREKDLATAELIALGLHVRDATAGRAKLFINGDLEAAHALGADGVHLSATGKSPAMARDQLGDRMLISVAAHCLEEACAAEREGADMVVLGAVFATGSHPGVQTIGLHGVETVAKAVAIPVIAIGGVTDANARACIEVGARGIAVIGAIHDSADPRAAAAKLRSAVGAA